MINFINDKILSIESIISIQKEEISKSESSISLFRNCLVKQNEALDVFIKERERLQLEKAKRTKESNNNEKDCTEIYESVMKISSQSKKKRRINRDNFKVFNNVDNKTRAETISSQNDNLDEEINANVVTPMADSLQTKRVFDNVDKETNAEEIKSQSDNFTKKVNANVVRPMVDNLQTKNTRTESVKSKIKSSYKNLHITNIPQKTITKIAVYDSRVCLGGTQGLLLKHAPKNTQLYDTNTEDDVIKIEIIKRSRSFDLLAFTKEKILIFQGMGASHQDVLLPGIGNVFNDVTVIYIPLKSGVIKKLYHETCEISDYVVHSHGELRCFVPGTGNNKYALVSLEDGLLYKTEKKEVKTMQVIDGVSNVRQILRIRYCNFLCCTDEKVLFFNSTFELLKTIEMNDGIKMIDVTYTSGVVVDSLNNLHLYRVLESGCFGPKIGQRSIEGNVTAVCIVKKNVLVAVGCDVFAVENIF